MKRVPLFGMAILADSGYGATIDTLWYGPMDCEGLSHDFATWSLPIKSSVRLSFRYWLASYLFVDYWVCNFLTLSFVLLQVNIAIEFGCLQFCLRSSFQQGLSRETSHFKLEHGEHAHNEHRLN